MKYCNVVWGQCNESLKDRLQVLQNRAVRAIAGQKFEHADHAKLLRDYDLLSVRNLIKLDMGVCMYKIQNDLAPEEFKNFFQPIGDVHGYNTRSVVNDDLHIPRLNIKQGQGAISYSGVKVWNDIPPEIRNAESINTFKVNFKKYIMRMQPD